MNKKTFVKYFAFTIIVVVIGIAVTLLALDKPAPTRQQPLSVLATVEAAGNQIVEMTAKAGFSPSSITASANKNTILKVNTQNTFDCSSVINIPSLGIRQSLPATGSTEIEIAAQAPGTTIEGTCSVGLYHFQLKFV